MVDAGRLSCAPFTAFDRGTFLYTFRLLMDHEAFYPTTQTVLALTTILVLTTKLAGSIKRSGHVPGHPEVAYELPAQSPQNVMSTRSSMSGSRKVTCQGAHQKQWNG